MIKVATPSEEMLIGYRSEIAMKVHTPFYKSIYTCTLLLLSGLHLLLTMVSYRVTQMVMIVDIPSIVPHRCTA